MVGFGVLTIGKDLILGNNPTEEELEELIEVEITAEGNGGDYYPLILRTRIEMVRVQLISRNLLS